MGTMSFDALIVSGGEGERARVIEIAKAVPSNRPWPEDWTELVSPIMKSLTNGYEWFFVAPDGSKEWWDTSNTGDEFRKAIIDLYGDDVVEVRWGELGQRLCVHGRTTIENTA